MPANHLDDKTTFGLVGSVLYRDLTSFYGGILFSHVT